MPRAYETIVGDLVSTADAIADYLEGLGYRLRVEEMQLSYPYRPAIVARRKPTTLIINVDTRIDPKRVDQWMRFGMSCSSDVRVAVCLPGEVSIQEKEAAFLAEKRLGLYLVAGGQVTERVTPMDLSVNVKLPDLQELHPRLRRLLGPVYEQFNKSLWREGFGDACQILEDQAKVYLKRRIKTGKVLILRKRRASGISLREVDRMTMGRLANAFEHIMTPNYVDSQTARLLNQINTDRIGVVHHKRRAATEQRLRKYVGQHLWSVVGGLKLLLGIE